MKTLMCPLPFVLLTTLALAPFAPAAAQQAFPTPDAAAQALVGELGNEYPDNARMATLFGANWRDFIPVGSVDRADVDAFLKRYRQRHSIETPAPNRALVSVGNGKEAWTLPVPMIKGPQGWRFDIEAGAEEIRVRRIGRNELDAAQSVLAYFDAQKDYAEADRDGDGVLEYAQKLMSTDGLHDGLFWSEDDSGQISPLGPLFGDARPAGDWHGYRFRILEAQGPSAPGGAYSYGLGGNMSRGFALVAWPASYGDTGVMSFMISHEGEVFEKDLGAKSEQLARAMQQFDPDDSWMPMRAAAAMP